MQLLIELFVSVSEELQADETDNDNSKSEDIHWKNNRLFFPLSK